LNLSDFTFSELKEKIAITDFDCGDPDLNEFLYNDSINYQNQLIAKTYLFKDHNSIVAFFSISNDVLTDKGERSIWNRLLRKIPNSKRKKVFPAVKLGRLGVSNAIQNGGLGKQIIELIIGLVLFESKSASRFLIVDAYNNQRTINFYTKNGFQFLLGDKDASENTRIMFLDLLPYWKAINLS
jgi:predicted GNAT family N-acyltransferase